MLSSPSYVVAVPTSTPGADEDILYAIYSSLSNNRSTIQQNFVHFS